MNDLMTPHAPLQRPLLWSDELVILLDTISSVPFSEPVYVVGGAVRDALRHQPVHDIDLVTRRDSVRLARRIADSLNGDVFVMDNERGIARVLFQTAAGHQHLDVTLFRGATLLEDLQARDITINAIAIDLHSDWSQIIDPLNGEQAILDKVILLCSPSALADDPIRALRVVRFSTQLGYRMHPETTAAVRSQAAQLRFASRERLRDELYKLLSTPKPTQAIRVAMALGVLTAVFPEMDRLVDSEQSAPNVFNRWDHTLYTVEKLHVILTAISPKRTDNTASVFDIGMLAIQLDRYRAKLNQHLNEVWVEARSHRPLMLLAALLHLVTSDDMNDSARGEAVADVFASRLRLSNGEQKRFVQMLGFYRTVLDTPDYTVLGTHRYWYLLGSAGIDALLLGLAHGLAIYGSELSQAWWLRRVELAIRWLSAYYDLHDTLVHPPPLLDGNELMAVLGIEPGRVVGQLLVALREAQVQAQIITRDDAISFARAALNDR